MAANPNPSPAQLEFFTVPSPCIGVCQAGPKGYCLGCYRSREERLYWLQIDDATRRKIITACHRRKLLASRRQSAQEEVPDEIIPIQQDMFGNSDDT